MGVDAVAAEAVAAREDAQGADDLVLEADGAREVELRVGLRSGLGVVLGGEGFEAGLDDGVLFGTLLVGLGVELVDLRLERVDLVVIIQAGVTSNGTLRSAGGAAGGVACAPACALGHEVLKRHGLPLAMVNSALEARS